jgi:hypothetical protein
VSNSSLAAPSASNVLSFAGFQQKNLGALPTGNCCSFLNTAMPESGHRHGHSHKHKRHPHRSSDDLLKAPEFRWEWFWSCCYCSGHAAMSTFIEQCPGCIHTRCSYCPMESIKIRISTGQPVHQSKAPSTPTFQAPETFHLNNSPVAP